MIPVVFDCGVLVSGIGWTGNPRQCLRLAAHAEAIVSNDRDLLCLGKPFGVAILTPVGFLKLVRQASGV